MHASCAIYGSPSAIADQHFFSWLRMPYENVIP